MNSNFQDDAPLNLIQHVSDKITKHTTESWYKNGHLGIVTNTNGRLFEFSPHDIMWQTEISDTAKHPNNYYEANFGIEYRVQRKLIHRMERFSGNSRYPEF